MMACYANIAINYNDSSDNNAMIAMILLLYISIINYLIVKSTK